ncbi:MAG: glucose-6-phosphate isomerase [Pseudomonadota bacterium]
MSSVATVINQLHHERRRIEAVTIEDRFDKDPDRFSRFSLSLDSLLFDFSKNRLGEPELDLLVRLAAETGLEDRRERMFAGAPINTTENRAVLHTALRSADQSGSEGPQVDGVSVVPEVLRQRERLRVFSDQVRDGTISGAAGTPFTDVVNLGVGGSDLGPALATEALKPYHDGPRVHFVSNVDAAHIADTLHGLQPERTLFLVASKTFSTDETMTNARTARKWLISALGGDAVGAHFVALSSKTAAVEAFGIAPERTFGFWDWVGGRYSLWSAIGLSVCLAIGFNRFANFLEGARSADRHFKTAPLSRNIPVIMGLLGVWYRNFWGFSTHAVVPYDQRLARFPAYLQQLDMESNGKRTRLDGTPVSVATGPVLWGDVGTNGQHAFFQLLHQGTDVVPVDFLVAAKGHEDLEEHHARLVANCFAQAEALMMGQDAAQPERVMPGNRPSNLFLYDRLDPRTLGLLIALYEHRVFVQGTIWGINSFDQWGVELGKKLAAEILPCVEGSQIASGRDGSTLGLIESFLSRRKPS